MKGTDTIEEYMAREVLPHIPDAVWFFEEDAKKGTAETGDDGSAAGEDYGKPG